MAAVLSACSAVKPGGPRAPNGAYADEFTNTDTYSRAFPGHDQATCEAARRALLSQGYLISEAKPSLLKGRKNFQPQGEVHVQIEFNVVCAADSPGSQSTTVFASAVRDRYSLKKSTNSASLGVGVLGSVSFPFGYSDDAMVKVASETIPSRDFYERFFSLVERYLDNGPGEPAQEEQEAPRAHHSAGSAASE
ncbi:MAG: DUF2242 domain-containing protein [Noviherbaspirillum sp.]